MLHKAIDMAVPGDVIVVDAGGDLSNALMGELMLAYAVKKGVAGFVLNAAIRDLDAFVATNLPTYAAGVTHRGPYKDGPGEINVPISLDGMVVEPGDIVIGDSDGVLSIPLSVAEEVLAKTEAKQDAETRQMRAIAEGTNDRSWVDAALKERGCAFPQT
jgi:regulator of RNase E activity RraA